MRAEKSTSTLPWLSVFLFASLWMLSAQADEPEQHNGVDKVYLPYVLPLERELEIRTIYQQDGRDSRDGLMRVRTGLGRSLSESLFVEVYLITKKEPQGNTSLEGYELETRLQLTEQGEFWADWGLLFEFERERSESITELSSTVLIAREWGRWTSALNLGIEYEFGSDIENEFETALAMQWRYRFREYLEPAVELYVDEITSALGPVATGLIRTSGQKKLHWETGVLFPLNDRTPDITLRFLIEYEF
ncbi:MAG: hypothetical protein RQ757_00555 [Pseudomonadales bacterium]|nr:hypothetical protein [Pseudomonadales bacterium]